MTTPPAAVPMTPERWSRIDAILQVVLAAEPAQRAEVVADACDGDSDLQREVESLLAAHDAMADDFLAPPVTGPVANAEMTRLATALDGRYRVEREIARGGMATVYLAQDLKHARPVAIKVLRAELAAALGAERFLAEIRITASLQHPHILPLFDSGSAEFPALQGGNLLWYAMPFVEGETLRARLSREGQLPVVEAVRIAREIADGLAWAHSRGVVHRDVKPENVLLQHGHALVADFGVALALEQAGGERLTRTGLTLGTPQYMAPEQAAGERALDARVDVYALGAVLHEMLVGEPPFAAPTRQAVVRRMMHELPPALATRRPEVQPFVDVAVRRALAKRPADRFTGAASFAAAITAPPDADAASASPSPGRTIGVRMASNLALAALVVGVIGGLLLDRSWLLRPSAAVPAPGGTAPVASNVQPPAEDGDFALTVVDRSGREVRGVAAQRPWTPRFSPDGRSLAYGAFGSGKTTSDLWVTDLASGTTRRLTDDDRDANDPQWSPDGKTITYSASAGGGKDLFARAVDGGSPRLLAARNGTQFASDWVGDGSALLVTEEAEGNRHDILVQPADGSPARPYAATRADETGARISPDGRWVAYTSDVSGRPEVYLDSYPEPSRRVLVSTGGGAHPAWRSDGRELFYWRDGALVALPLDRAVGGPPAHGAESILFRAPYIVGVNTMYDVSADGQRFVIVRSRR